MNKKKIKLFDIEIDKLTMNETVKTVSDWVEEKEYKSRYVVTPNVDHIVNLHKNKSFKNAYKNAALVVADGKPVVFTSKLFGKGLPEVVPGSDLVPNLFDYYQSDLNKSIKVFLLGAMPGVADKAADVIKAKWPNVQVVGSYSPNYGFEKSVEESNQICELVNSKAPDVVVFGVGAPKQEVWSSTYGQHLNTSVILCVGATIDFIAGEKSRAPLWMQKVGLEWLYRVANEPRRLLKRYVIDAIIFPLLVWKEWHNKNNTLI